jgi:hypothetical protein
MAYDSRWIWGLGGVGIKGKRPGDHLYRRTLGKDREAGLIEQMVE